MVRREQWTKSPLAPATESRYQGRSSVDLVSNVLTYDDSTPRNILLNTLTDNVNDQLRPSKHVLSRLSVRASSRLAEFLLRSIHQILTPHVLTCFLFLSNDLVCVEAH